MSRLFFAYYTLLDGNDQPNKLSLESNIHLMTHEEAWNQFDSEQNTILLYLKKNMITGFCRSWSSEDKILTVMIYVYDRGSC